MSYLPDETVVILVPELAGQHQRLHALQIEDPDNSPRGIPRNNVLVVWILRGRGDTFRIDWVLERKMGRPCLLRSS